MVLVWAWLSNIQLVRDKRSFHSPIFVGLFWLFSFVKNMKHVCRYDFSKCFEIQTTQILKLYFCSRDRLYIQFYMCLSFSQSSCQSICLSYILLCFSRYSRSQLIDISSLVVYFGVLLLDVFSYKLNIHFLFAVDFTQILLI